MLVNHFKLKTFPLPAELGQNPTDKEFFEVVSTVDREMKGLIGKRRPELFYDLAPPSTP